MRGLLVSLIFAAAAAGPVLAAPATKGPKLDPVTKVDGENLQVVFGQRAVFHIDEAGRPAIDAVETGKLADAHPRGVVKDTFTAPEAGRLAAALDGSAEKRLSVLKLWNGLAHPVEYRLAILVLRKGQLEVKPVKTCALAPGQAHSLTWPQPVVAVALARFVEASAEAQACRAPTPP